MTSMQQFKPDTGGRLDKIASSQLDISRSKVKKAIQNRQITLNGKPADVSDPVSPKDTVEYNKELVRPKKVKPHAPPGLDILFENDHVLVVNKPAGLLVHKTETSDEPTLVDGLVAHNPDTKNTGQKVYRAGLVHRLDKWTSGVLVTAKTQKAYEHLKSLFKERKVRKKYTALVHGEMEKPHDTINFPIARSKTHGRMAARPTSQNGRRAVTHYDVTKRYVNFTLLDVEIETGRTHQIRAHMFAIGHPVAGDKLYKQKGVKPADLNRLFLHARELSLTLPNGKHKIFTATLPEELQKFLNTLQPL